MSAVSSGGRLEGRSEVKFTTAYRRPRPLGQLLACFCYSVAAVSVTPPMRQPATGRMQTAGLGGCRTLTYAVTRGLAHDADLCCHRSQGLTMRAREWLRWRECLRPWDWHLRCNMSAAPAIFRPQPSRRSGSVEQHWRPARQQPSNWSTSGVLCRNNVQLPHGLLDAACPSTRAPLSCLSRPRSVHHRLWASEHLVGVTPMTTAGDYARETHTRAHTPH